MEDPKTEALAASGPAGVPHVDGADLAARARIRRTNRARRIAGVVGFCLVAMVALFAIFGPVLVPRNPNVTNLPLRLQPPFSRVDGELFVLGTDALGRDLLARLAVGARASLSVVVSALLLGGGIGCTLGLVAGYYGGWVDNLIMRATDAQLAIPTAMFAMLLGAVLGGGFTNTVVAVGISAWPVYARVLRGEVIRIKEQEFVLVASTLGVSTTRQIVRHIGPNLVGALAVVATLELGSMILVESTLSFVGLGIQPPNASLGSMIRGGQEFIYTAWWLATLPGATILITVLGMNLAGDWLRDLLDPKK